MDGNGSSSKVIRDYRVSDGILRHEDTLRLRQSFIREPLHILQDRYDTHGFLFMKGLLPRSNLDDLLASIGPCAPVNCCCTSCPQLTRSILVDNLQAPELTRFVGSLVAQDSDSSAFPLQDNTLQGSVAPVRAW